LQWNCDIWAIGGNMNFETCLNNKTAKKVETDLLRAKSMFISSEQAIYTAKLIPLSEKTCKSIFRELYEALKETFEAIGYIRGFKFLDHASVFYFIRDYLKKESLADKFDRYRKLRNGINYYGESIRLESVKEALKDIPETIKSLKNDYFT